MKTLKTTLNKLDAAMKRKPVYPDLIDWQRLNRHGPASYQDKLFDVVCKLKPNVAVETGTRKGIATVAMFAAGAEHIYSCDPLYRNQVEATAAIERATGIVLPADAWTFYGEKSVDALEQIPAREWDLFIHDSDHGAVCMSFELAYAWNQLRAGGVLVCDDWNTCMHAKKHTAFLDFCQRHNVLYDEMGSAAVVVKS